MPYDRHTADRIHRILQEWKVDFYEKPMFGGLCFMVDDKMACGLHYDKKKATDLLMARIGTDATPEALEREHCHPMDFSGRPMKGYVFVTLEGYDAESDLDYYMDKVLAFNPLAKSSRKKGK